VGGSSLAKGNVEAYPPTTVYLRMNPLQNPNGGKENRIIIRKEKERISKIKKELAT